MGDLIDFKASMESMGIFRATGTRPAVPESFDSLACPYCGTITPPADVLQDWTVIYRCTCRMVFSVSKDGVLRRGVSGVPLR